MTTLQITWFVIIAALFAIYAILDGFDLGVGFWHLFGSRNADRKHLLAAIAPYWDGNEVWLLTGGAALFAAFPPVYAAVFSGFYLALMLVLWGLILRAVCIEYREKAHTPAGQNLCDLGFGLGSVIPGLLFGVALGNILRGIPLNAAGDYSGTFIGLLNPFSLAVGVVGLAALATHGAAYLASSPKDDMSEHAAGWALLTWPIYAAGALAVLFWGWHAYPYLQTNYRASLTVWVAPALCVLAILSIPALLWAGARRIAFVASSISLATFLATAAIALFPDLAPASNGPGFSLTIADSSSEKTLTVMLWVALIGLPIVIAYTIFIYYMLSKKVTPEERTY